MKKFFIKLIKKIIEFIKYTCIIWLGTTLAFLTIGYVFDSITLIAFHSKYPNITANNLAETDGDMN